MAKIYLTEWREDQLIEKMVALYDDGYSIMRISTVLRHEDGVDVSFAFIRRVFIELDVVCDEIKYPGKADTPLVHNESESDDV